MHGADQAIRGIARVDQVEFAIQVRRNFSAAKRNRKTRWRSLISVARTNRKRGTAHNHRRARRRKFKRGALGAKLAQAVGANHVLLLKAGVLNGANSFLGRCKNAFGADIQHALCAGIKCGAHDMHCRDMIDGIKFAAIAPPQVWISRKVVHLITTAHRLIDR